MAKAILPASITDTTTEALADMMPGPGSIDLTPMLVTDYDTCPAVLLPLHVERLQLQDFVLPGTPEITVRDLCKNARTLHATSGTRFAVEQVLSSLAISATITEWFEAVPQAAPYTFNVVALVKDNLSESEIVLDAETQAQAVQLVTAVNRASVTFDLSLGVEVSSHFNLAAMLNAHQSFSMQGAL